MVYKSQILFHFTALSAVWVFLPLHTPFFLHIFLSLYKPFVLSPLNAIPSPPVNPSSSGVGAEISCSPESFPKHPCLALPTSSPALGSSPQEHLLPCAPYGDLQQIYPHPEMMFERVGLGRILYGTSLLARQLAYSRSSSKVGDGG